jgi:hypothetical protein
MTERSSPRADEDSDVDTPFNRTSVASHLEVERARADVVAVSTLEKRCASPATPKCRLKSASHEGIRPFSLCLNIQLKIDFGRGPSRKGMLVVHLREF